MTHLQTLTRFNAWRRGDDDIEQPDPKAIGEAIDWAVRDVAMMMMHRKPQGRRQGAGGYRCHGDRARLLTAIRGGKAGYFLRYGKKGISYPIPHTLGNDTSLPFLCKDF
jgi:hypothetical protein